MIRARIAEKRIFEARFLFRQFGDAIGTQQKQKLADELAAVLAEAEQLLQRARAHAAGGERVQAEELYREIEKKVIDMPGVADEARALAGAAALTLKMNAAAPLVPDPEQQFDFAPELEEIGRASLTSGRRSPEKQSARRLLWLAAGAGLLTVSLLAFLYKDIKKAGLPFSFSNRSSETIQIRPIVTTGRPDMEQPSPGPGVSEADGQDNPEYQTFGSTLSSQSSDTAVPALAGKVRVHPLTTVQAGALQEKRQSTGR